MGTEHVLSDPKLETSLWRAPDIQCPFCNVVCWPDAKAKDGTIIYNKHNCWPVWGRVTYDRRLEVDPDGKLLI